MRSFEQTQITYAPDGTTGEAKKEGSGFEPKSLGRFTHTDMITGVTSTYTIKVSAAHSYGAAWRVVAEVVGESGFTIKTIDPLITYHGHNVPNDRLIEYQLISAHGYRQPSA